MKDQVKPKAGQVWRTLMGTEHTLRSYHPDRGAWLTDTLMGCTGTLFTMGDGYLPGMTLVKDVPDAPRTPQPGDVWRFRAGTEWGSDIAGKLRIVKAVRSGSVQWDGGATGLAEFLRVFEFVRAADAPEASKPAYVETAEERKRLFKQAVKELEEAVAASKVPHGPTCSCWTCEKDRLYITKEREAKIAAEMTTVNASYQESERQRRDKEAIKRNMVGPMNFGGLTMGWDKRGRR
jgi:hypothetical protein